MPSPKAASNDRLERLPSLRVIEEARTYLRASNIIEKVASNGDFALYWPAALNTGLALELFLKAFHVEFNPETPTDSDDPEFDPEGYLRLSNASGRGHDLLKLYKGIPVAEAVRLREISERLRPGYSLEAAIGSCSKLFVGARYTYERNSLQSFYKDIFDLAPHLEKVLEEMVREPMAGSKPAL